MFVNNETYKQEEMPIQSDRGLHYKEIQDYKSVWYRSGEKGPGTMGCRSTEKHPANNVPDVVP